MTLDDGELRLVEGPRLLEDRIRDGELADVVKQSPGGQRAETVGRQPQLLADLDGAQGYPPGALLRVLVLLCEADHEGADAGAEEGLLGGDQLPGPRSAGERAGRRPAIQVGRDGDSDEHDPDELEAVAEPPAEVLEIEQKGRAQSRAEEGQPEDDQQVRSAACEEVRVHGAQAEEAVEEEPDAEGGERR